MKKYIRYLKYVLLHKWYVFLEARKLGIFYLGIIHDISKFSPVEFFPYTNFFYGRNAKTVRDKTGYYKPEDTGDSRFEDAWFHHQKVNKHHWQYWVIPTEHGGSKALPIPDKYRREMLADWRGAGRAQKTPDSLFWYIANKDKMLLHPETREWIEKMLGYYETVLDQ